MWSTTFESAQRGEDRGDPGYGGRDRGLAPIPMPWVQQWVEFRQRVLPVLVFLGATGLAGLLWQDAVTPMFSGVGEGLRAGVASGQGGVVQEVHVRPFQQVREGDLLATVAATDPRVLLGLLQSELQWVQMRFAPRLGEENALDLERVRVEVMRTRAELAVARVNLLRAQNDVDRQGPLHEARLVSTAVFDLSLKTRDAFQVEVRERERALGEMEKRLVELGRLGDPGLTTPEEEHRLAILERLGAARVGVASNTTLVRLYAPISGQVGYVGRQAGEHVVEGEPFIQVQGLEADRVVGYLRQPYPVDPRVGMEVELTTRGPVRRRFRSEIIQVGAQLEVITNALAQVRMGALVDVGLPVVVGVPPRSGIRPGEVVDLVIKTRSAEYRVMGWQGGEEGLYGYEEAP